MRGGRLLAALLLSPASLRAQSPVVIRVDVDSVANVIDPHDALGAGVDGHGRGTVDAIYTPANIRAMRDVGFSRLTYRLRTELGVEAWHWNPVGRWSDSAHAQGYWTSDSTSARPIMLSHGYRLPRRGNTIDQAENAGYSRLDDGDTASFWKSNPYLDHRFTGESDARHPQVVIVDLARPTDVTAIQVAWGAPYATSYRIQYWRGEPARDPDENPDGKWVTFPGGAESAGTGGLERRTLSPRPIRARFVRIVMSASSGTALPGSRDPRDSSGYAIREIWLGQLDQAGAFHDAMRHGKSRTTQTLTFASSTDPWHRATDIDLDLEQPGFDLVQQSGLAEGRGAMIPVGILFDTPENGANALRYLRARGVPVERVELGEEPDGQYATPEDVAELYRRFADALAAVDTALTLGGPSFQGLSTRVQFAWPNDTAGAPWMARFLADLQAHAALGTFRFLSFEWYPYDDICGRTAPQLAEAPERLREALEQVAAESVPPSTPLVIAEYGYSAFAGRPQVDIEGALLNADILGSFFTLGGRAAYLYGWEPTWLDREPHCDSWGNNALFLADGERRIRYRVATYYGARLAIASWFDSAGGPHEVHPAHSDLRDTAGHELVTAYAVRRPGGGWSVMVINKDPNRSHAVRVDFRGAGRLERPFAGRIRLSMYSRAQYRWHPQGSRGYPDPDLPPATSERDASELIAMPPYSLAVIRGVVR